MSQAENMADNGQTQLQRTGTTEDAMPQNEGRMEIDEPLPQGSVAPKQPMSRQRVCVSEKMTLNAC